MQPVFPLLLGAFAFALSAAPPAFTINHDVQAALDRISPDDMRGNLSFLSSDLLEGRDTPSRGLDLAAEFIASQFRRARLQPAGNEGYFQTAMWKYAEPPLDAMQLTLRYQSQTFAFVPRQVTIRFFGELNLDNAAILKVDPYDADALRAFKSEQVAGKVVVMRSPIRPDMSPDERRKGYRAAAQLQKILGRLQPALILSVDASDGGGGAAGRLEGEEQMTPAPPAPLLSVHSAEFAAVLEKMPNGLLTGGAVTARLPEPRRREVLLKNVAGVLRGSDPQLKDTYVLVTAHYDHVGIASGGAGDRVYNGANDDGSGIVSLIELANALSSLEQPPRRSIVFLSVFGEEKGLLGSTFYARHPLFPLDKTVANVNLEQIGRTDSNDGPQVGTATFTGFTFSEVPAIFQAAGELTGVKVYGGESGDPFFDRSDNLAFAKAGIPAHTACVAYEYPDYHAVGDHWDKIDYDNMARVNRMFAVGILMIADNPQAPKWNAENAKTEPYRRARTTPSN